MSATIDFSVEDLTFTLDDNSRKAILDLVLAWGRYDGLISQWVLHAFGLSLDSGSILLGNMDTRTKLERLKGLYQHHGMSTAMRKISKLQKGHLEFASVRNLIAHSGCCGQLNSKPWLVAFAPVRTTKGQLDNMVVELVSVSIMQNAGQWLEDVSDSLQDFIRTLQLLDALPPSEPPEFPRVPHSNPQS